MILAALIAIPLVIAVSADQRTLDPAIAQPSMTGQQKSTVLRRLIRSATDCVVRTVAADPRLQQSISFGDVTPLIVDSMGSCVDDVRAMIDAHDRLYGEGSGEAFFMGPYLDILPTMVDKRIR
jgi:hypothetical protein